MRIGFVPLAAGLLIAALSPAAARVEIQRPVPMVSVRGEADVAARPDVARAIAGVTTEAKTPREAADANTRVMSVLIAAAKQAGVADKDIRTAGFSINPVHATRNRETPQVVAYRASNRVMLTLRDIGRVGEILDVLTQAGATDIGGVSFGLSESSKLLDQARMLAFADAKRKAELYAQAAGLQLGRAISIDEDAAPPPRAYRAAQAAAASSVPIEPGEETLRVGVTVSFELLN
jgi:uncharacterized protein YggE